MPLGKAGWAAQAAWVLSCSPAAATSWEAHCWAVQGGLSLAVEPPLSPEDEEAAYWAGSDQLELF